MKAFVLQALLAALVSSGALLAYDRLVARPAQRVGIVDIGEVYRRQEAEFTRTLTNSTSQEDRERAFAKARTFAKRLPVALDELPRDCACLVVLRYAVAGAGPRSIDLTDQLTRKLEAP